MKAAIIDIRTLADLSVWLKDRQERPNHTVIATTNVSPMSDVLPSHPQGQDDAVPSSSQLLFPIATQCAAARVSPSTP
jgi:hypothetical protein